MHPDPVMYLQLHRQEMERTYAHAELVRQARLARRQAAAGYDADETFDPRDGVVAALARRLAMFTGLRSQRQHGV